LYPERVNIRLVTLLTLLTGVLGALIYKKNPVLNRVSPDLEAANLTLSESLEEKGMQVGDEVYLRVFKKERVMEVWMQRQEAQQFELLKVYPIAAMSGKLGPKLREGDYQAPEGFYQIYKSSLNPYSSYHLSFNIGYPNQYDRAHGRTGSYIMVHGGAASAGCYAMTDPGVEEIYLLVSSALEAGQRQVHFHSFPYRFSEPPSGIGRWNEFWQELYPAYTWFEQYRTVPPVRVRGRQYVIEKQD